MFRNYRIMPDELSRQEPKLLFEMLDTLRENTNAAKKVNYDSPYIRAVFG